MSIGVRVRDDETFEQALRRFNKFCEKTGLKSDIKSLGRYDNPSTIKRNKHRRAKQFRKHQMLKELREQSSHIPRKRKNPDRNYRGFQW